MSNTRSVVLGLAIMVLSATGAMAEMPVRLKGTWILDAEATAALMKTSPKWKAEDEKYLPTILKRMSLMLYEFEDHAISVSMRGKKQVLAVVLQESSAKKHVFKGTVEGETVAMTVSFVGDATIKIRSSSTDDMDYYLWKRGRLTGAADADGKSDAIEIMKKSLTTPSGERAANEGK